MATHTSRAGLKTCRALVFNLRLENTSRTGQLLAAMRVQRAKEDTGYTRNTVQIVSGHKQQSYGNRQDPQEL